MQSLEFLSLSWQAWYTVAVILMIVVALLRNMARPELVLLGALGLVLGAGVLEPDEAFQGFASTAVLAIAALYVVAAGVQRTEALRLLDNFLLSPSGSIKATMPRLMTITAILSAFLNNTPIVAMFIPRVQQWCRRKNLSPSLFLIPLSYAAILGGMTTLIGTSTNIVVSELLVEQGYDGLGMFDLTLVGGPAVLIVLIYFSVFGYRLLPKKDEPGQIFQGGLDRCLFELKVAKDSVLSGKTVEESGLRSLGNAYLAHIRRDKQLIPSAPEEVLRSNDRLTFTGSVAILEDLIHTPGLERVVEPISLDDEETLPLFEAIVSKSSSLVGRTLKDVGFREKYNAVVLGIHRQGEQLMEHLGKTPLMAGDLLIIEASYGFAKRWNMDRKDFYLVAPRRQQQKKPMTKKAPVALAILLLMVIGFSTGVLPLVTATFIAALAMLATRCIQSDEARSEINFSVLVVIGAALGIGKAVANSGLALAVAGLFTSAANILPPIIVILLLYVLTNLLTELITNQAAAILMLPIGIEVAGALGIGIQAIAMTVALAASASFITPFGYQTNLMVMSAGGYQFKDYTKVGLPVSIIVMVVVVTMLYFFWI